MPYPHHRILVAYLAMFMSQHRTTVLASDEACQEAYSNVISTEDGSCDIAGLSLEELNSDPCPADCQALYDQLLGSCSIGDSYTEFGSTSLEYTQSTLAQTEGHKWASCNYGFTPNPCARAYSYLNELDCLEVLLTTEERDGPCPAECQAAFDNIVSNCQAGVDNTVIGSGDVLGSGLASLDVHAEARIWHDFGERAQCDYGYDPTSCDLAVRDLSDNAEPDIVFVTDRPKSCVYDDNSSSCTVECKRVIDDVVSSCQPGAIFAPEVGHLKQTNRPIPFQGPESLEWMGFNSDILGITFGALSEPCWDYYLTNSPSQSSFSSSSATIYSCIRIVTLLSMAWMFLF